MAVDSLDGHCRETCAPTDICRLWYGVAGGNDRCVEPRHHRDAGFLFYRRIRRDRLGASRAGTEYVSVDGRGSGGGHHWWLLLRADRSAVKFDAELDLAAMLDDLTLDASRHDAAVTVGWPGFRIPTSTVLGVHLDTF